MPIAQHHLDHLIEHGYAVVPAFLTAREVKAARKNILRYYPPPKELAKFPQRYESLLAQPENLKTEFPFIGDALNDMTTHPGLIDLAERLLSTRDVLLSRSAVWVKYAGLGNFDQGLHTDFEGNTLVYPRDDGPYRQVNLILYYTDVGPDDGPTHVLDTRDTPKKGSAPLWPAFRTRMKDPELYTKAKPILVKAGALLIFGMSTLHRGSEVMATSGVRLTQHLVYRCGGHRFTGYQSWASYGELDRMTHFLERATPRQREAVGFPVPGDQYWTPATLAGVAARYPKMDMKPYRKAMVRKS